MWETQNHPSSPAQQLTTASFGAEDCHFEGDPNSKWWQKIPGEKGKNEHLILLNSNFVGGHLFVGWIKLNPYAVVVVIVIVILIIITIIIIIKSSNSSSVAPRASLSCCMIVNLVASSRLHVHVFFMLLKSTAWLTSAGRFSTSNPHLNGFA